MDISRDSWHKRFISWIYNEKDGEIITDFNNLCSYFWLCLVTFGLLPLFLLVKLVLVLIDKTSNIKSENIVNYIKQTFFALGVIGYFLIGIYTGWIELLIITGVLIGLFVLAITGIAFGGFIKEKYDERHEDKPKKPHITLEWIKAKKGKHCPRVNWVD